MILVGALVGRTGEAAIGELRRVHVGVAEVERQLLAHLDAETGQDVVRPGRVAIVEAVGLEARAGRVERSNAAVDARSAEADAEIRLDRAFAVEVLNDVEHQVRDARGAGAARADRSSRLEAEEAVRNFKLDVAVAGHAFETDAVIEAVAEAKAEHRVDFRSGANIDPAVATRRRVNVLDAVNYETGFRGTVPTILCICSRASRHHGGGRGGAQKCSFHYRSPYQKVFPGGRGPAPK